MSPPASRSTRVTLPCNTRRRPERRARRDYGVSRVELSDVFPARLLAATLVTLRGRAANLPVSVLTLLAPLASPNETSAT